MQLLACRELPPCPQGDTVTVPMPGILQVKGSLNLEFTRPDHDELRAIQEICYKRRNISKKEIGQDWARVSFLLSLSKNAETKVVVGHSLTPLESWQ